MSDTNNDPQAKIRPLDFDSIMHRPPVVSQKVFQKTWSSKAADDDVIVNVTICGKKTKIRNFHLRFLGFKYLKSANFGLFEIFRFLTPENLGF